MAYLGGGSTTNDATGTSIAATYSPSNTAGSLLVAVIAWASNATLAGVSDTQGNTWTLIGTRITDTNDQSVQMAYALNAKAGANTVTATLAAGASRLYRRILIAEYSGVLTTGAFDQTAGQMQANTTAANNVTSGATATLAQADELVVSGTMDVNNATNTITAGTGFTKRLEAGLCALEDKTVSSTTGVAGTWTFATAGRAVTHVATFKLAGGGGTPADATSLPARTGAPVATMGAVAAAAAIAGSLAITGAPYAPAGVATAGSSVPASVTSEPARTGSATAPMGVVVGETLVDAGSPATTGAASAIPGSVAAAAATTGPATATGRPYAPTGTATAGTSTPADVTSLPAATGHPHAPTGTATAGTSIPGTASSLSASTGPATAPTGTASAAAMTTSGAAVRVGIVYVPAGAAVGAAVIPAAATSPPAVTGRAYAPAGRATVPGADDGTGVPRGELTLTMPAADLTLTVPTTSLEITV